MDERDDRQLGSDLRVSTVGVILNSTNGSGRQDLRFLHGLVNIRRYRGLFRDLERSCHLDSLALRHGPRYRPPSSWSRLRVHRAESSISVELCCILAWVF